MMFIKRLIFLFSILAAQSSHATTATFLCYDELLRINGYYEKAGGLVKAIPTELSFNTDTKDITKRTGYEWQCQTLNWGDPLVYFFCSYTTEQKKLIVSVELFDRDTSRYVSKAVSPNDFLSMYSKSDVGQNADEKINLPYKECMRKGF